MVGFVYFIGTPTFGWYKIGKSKTPEVRIRDLGILLPFKLEVLAVWRAENHHQMERALHEIYAPQKINGEWFEFSRKQAQEVIDKIPSETRVPQESDRFSNVAEDTKRDKKVIGVRVQKLRGDFTPEEREARRLAAIELQRAKKAQKSL